MKNDEANTINAKGATVHEPRTICVGDRVRDPLDGEDRTVTSIDTEENTVQLEDGGTMGIDEITDVLLPSEKEPTDSEKYNVMIATHTVSNTLTGLLENTIDNAYFSNVVRWDDGFTIPPQSLARILAQCDAVNEAIAKLKTVISPAEAGAKTMPQQGTPEEWEVIHLLTGEKVAGKVTDHENGLGFVQLDVFMNSKVAMPILTMRFYSDLGYYSRVTTTEAEARAMTDKQVGYTAIKKTRAMHS